MTEADAHGTHPTANQKKRSSPTGSRSMASEKDLIKNLRIKTGAVTRCAARPAPTARKKKKRAWLAFADFLLSLLNVYACSLCKDTVQSKKEIQSQKDRIERVKVEEGKDEHDVRKQGEVLQEYVDGLADELDRLDMSWGGGTGLKKYIVRAPHRCHVIARARTGLWRARAPTPFHPLPNSLSLTSAVCALSLLGHRRSSRRTKARRCSRSWR